MIKLGIYTSRSLNATLNPEASSSATSFYWGADKIHKDVHSVHRESISTTKYVNTKYTNTQIHKYTNTQIHR